MDGRPLLDRLRPLIDTDCGVLGEPEPLVFPPGYEGQMYGFSVSVAHVSAPHSGPVSVAGLAGYGTAWDEQTARIRACCEGLERYCSMM